MTRFRVVFLVAFAVAALGSAANDTVGIFLILSSCGVLFILLPAVRVLEARRQRRTQGLTFWAAFKMANSKSLEQWHYKSFMQAATIYFLAAPTGAFAGIVIRWAVSSHDRIGDITESKPFQLLWILIGGAMAVVSEIADATRGVPLKYWAILILIEIFVVGGQINANQSAVVHELGQVKEKLKVLDKRLAEMEEGRR